MKKFISDTIARFFTKEQSSDRIILADETTILNRNENFKQRYRNWMQSGDYAQVVKALKTNFLHGEPVEGSRFPIDFHYTPGANGFSIDGRATIDTDTYRFLADYFKEKVLGMNYRLYSSVAERKNRVDKIIHLERHYLKPAAWSEEMPMEQLFGNIMIELEITDGKVDYLKVLATYYTGFNYKPAKSFDELALLLLEEYTA